MLNHRYRVLESKSRLLGKKIYPDRVDSEFANRTWLLLLKDFIFVRIFIHSFHTMRYSIKLDLSSLNINLTHINIKFMYILNITHLFFNLGYSYSCHQFSTLKSLSKVCNTIG